MKIFYGGTWREITSAKVYYAGSWRPLVNAKAYYNGAWRDVVTFVLPLTVTASDFEGASTTSSVNAICSAVPSGGLAPYTYSWAIIASAGGTFSLSNATSANVTVIATGVPRGGSATCTVRCTVTDNLGSPATATANGVLTNEGSTGGGGSPL